MSIDFTGITGISDDYGVVTQIADAQGRVIWAVPSGGKVILEVEKITSDTYAAETTYTGEQFILLDIYPKTNGTVSVTYGGLTKTITDTSGAAEPNAQQVFFGTFNGVSDEVETPASGELVIEGDYYAFGSGSFQNGSKSTNLGYGLITAVDQWGEITTIPDHAFRGGLNMLEVLEVPDTVLTIGNNAFLEVDGLQTLIIGKGVKSIGYVIASPNLALTTIKMLGTTPPELKKSELFVYSFCDPNGTEEYSITKIIVPKGCGDTYKAAEGWSTYADYIVEES